MQGPRYWRNLVEVSLDTLCRIEMLRFNLSLVLQGSKMDFCDVPLSTIVADLVRPPFMKEVGGVGM